MTQLFPWTDLDVNDFSSLFELTFYLLERSEKKKKVKRIQSLRYSTYDLVSMWISRWTLRRMEEKRWKNNGKKESTRSSTSYWEAAERTTPAKNNVRLCRVLSIEYHWGSRGPQTFYISFFFSFSSLYPLHAHFNSGDALYSVLYLSHFVIHRILHRSHESNFPPSILFTILKISLFPRYSECPEVEKLDKFINNDNNKNNNNEDLNWNFPTNKSLFERQKKCHSSKPLIEMAT